MNESSAAIFAKIALEKGFLDERKLEQARVLQRLARRDGKEVALDQACLELEILSREQVRGLERGIRYYVVRKADKIYGKLAIAKRYVDPETVKHCLARQRTEFYRKHRLVRLAKLLGGLDAIAEEEDAELRALVTARLSPEESHHETEAVTEPEGPAGAEPEEAEAVPIEDSDDAVEDGGD